MDPETKTDADVLDETTNPDSTTEVSPDTSKLVPDVEARLKAVFGDEAKDESNDMENESLETSNDKDIVEDKDEPEVKSNDLIGDKVETTVDKEAAVDDSTQESDAPTLPQAYVRSLLAYGWTDDEIKGHLEAYGSKFIDTAAKIHSNRNDEIEAWAERGRKLRQSGPDQVTDTKSGESDRKTQTTSIPQTLKAIDVDALKERYGEDEFVDTIARPINDLILAVNAVLPQLQAGIASTQQEAQKQLAQSVEEFFNSADLKDYSTLYGNSKNGITEEHSKTRNRVLEVADALIGGMQDQGKNVSVYDALMLAHETVSRNFTESVIRNRLKDSLTKREKTISLKPSKRTAAAAPNSESDKRTALESTVAQKLAQAFPQT